MPKPRAVGIDLGTTYSATAWVDEAGHSTLIPNAEGDLLTPSVVLFEDGQVLVGKEAKKLGVYEANRLCECVKRDMGQSHYSRPVHGHQLPPEVIQGFVLKKLKDDITPIAGDDVKVVITVPAFFDEPRRKATVDAAQMAGLDVLDIVNEPTAAALAFGEDLGYLKASVDAPDDTIYVLVYDLGGGTFDATIIEMKAGDLRTVATDGDVRLGGRDWDETLVDFAANKFLTEHGQDPRQDHVSHQRMLVAAEEAKHTLSARNSAILKVPHAGQQLDIRVTREEFEEETAHLLERTAYVTRQLLTASGLTWSDLGRILLVGGSTRMPMVSRMLEERTGIAPDHTVNPDEAVARGAALYAEFLMAEAGTAKARFQITNVNSHSLGIEGVDPRTGRKGNNIIIPKNSPLPARKQKRFETKRQNQRSVVIKVLEGESPVPDECTPIGRTVIRDLPQSLAAGSSILVTYEYGTNGRLNVWAEVTGTDREVHLELEREGSLSSNTIKQWSRVVLSGGGLNACVSMLRGEVPEPVAEPVPTPHSRAAAAAGSSSPSPSPEPPPRPANPPATPPTPVMPPAGPQTAAPQAAPPQPAPPAAQPMPPAPAPSPSVPRAAPASPQPVPPAGAPRVARPAPAAAARGETDSPKSGRSRGGVFLVIGLVAVLALLVVSIGLIAGGVLF